MFTRVVRTLSVWSKALASLWTEEIEEHSIVAIYSVLLDFLRAIFLPPLSLLSRPPPPPRALMISVGFFFRCKNGVWGKDGWQQVNAENPRQRNRDLREVPQGGRLRAVLHPQDAAPRCQEGVRVRLPVAYQPRLGWGLRNPKAGLCLFNLWFQLCFWGILDRYGTLSCFFIFKVFFNAPPPKKKCLPLIFFSVEQIVGHQLHLLECAYFSRLVCWMTSDAPF